jgi:hypothetical protein
MRRCELYFKFDTNQGVAPATPKFPGCLKAAVPFGGIYGKSLADHWQYSKMERLFYRVGMAMLTRRPQNWFSQIPFSGLRAFPNHSQLWRC